MNSKQPSMYIKGNSLKEKILLENGIISNSESHKTNSVLACSRCTFINAIDCKYCSKCSYPLTAAGYEEIKEQENAKFRSLEERFSTLQSQVQSLITALSGLNDQNHLNQTAQILYKSGILNSANTKNAVS